MTKITNKKTAFSLVELALVIIISGVLLALILQSSEMIRSFKIMGARALTKSSAVNSIPGIVAWFDTTSETGFNKKQAFDGTKISLWNDVNSQSGYKNSATQELNSAQPSYTFETSVANGLPFLRFDGNDYLNLPDGTIPSSNYSYSFFIIIRTPSISESYGIIGSGDSERLNSSNMINYRAGGFIENNWQKNTLITPSISVTAGKIQLFTIMYDNEEGRSIYVNSDLKGKDTNIFRSGLATNNTIGKSSVHGIPDMYLKGDIGEIIIFGRAVNKDERKTIEKYLMKKWGITL